MKKGRLLTIQFKLFTYLIILLFLYQPLVFARSQHMLSPDYKGIIDEIRVLIGRGYGVTSCAAEEEVRTDYICIGGTKIDTSNKTQVINGFRINDFKSSRRLSIPTGYEVEINEQMRGYIVLETLIDELGNVHYLFINSHLYSRVDYREIEEVFNKIISSRDRTRKLIELTNYYRHTRLENLPSLIDSIIGPDYGNMPEVIFIDQMSSSPYIAASRRLKDEDGKDIAWVGINSGLVNIKDPSMKSILIGMAISHALHYNVNPLPDDEKELTSMECFLDFQDSIILIMAVLNNTDLDFEDIHNALKAYVDIEDFKHLMRVGKNAIIRELVGKLSSSDSSIRRNAAEELINLGDRNNNSSGIPFVGSIVHWLKRHKLLEKVEIAGTVPGLKRKVRDELGDLLGAQITIEKTKRLREIFIRYCDGRGIPYPSNIEKGYEREVYEWLRDFLFNSLNMEIGGISWNGKYLGRRVEITTKFADLPIWVIDDTGKVITEAMEWLQGWTTLPDERKKERRYEYNGTKVSLRDIANGICGDTQEGTDLDDSL